MKQFVSKQLLVFDMDDTLCESKALPNAEMVELLCALSKFVPLAVISGASKEQLLRQIARPFGENGSFLRRLYLLPTCGAQFLSYGDTGWESLYAAGLLEKEKEEIMEHFARILRELGHAHPPRTHGDVLEDRGTQITFSALGQHAPASNKRLWDPTGEKRQRIKDMLQPHLPHFEIKLGGTTSIDVTRKGIDKAYGIMQLERVLSVPRQHMLFFGDALFEGGNDFPVLKTGVDAIKVDNHHHTHSLLSELLVLFQASLR